MSIKKRFKDASIPEEDRKVTSNTPDSVRRRSRDAAIPPEENDAGFVSSRRKVTNAKGLFDSLMLWDNDKNELVQIKPQDLASAIKIEDLSGIPTIGVDHATVVLTAGVGLTGGGDITVSRTFDLDITDGMSADTTVGASDIIAIHDGAMKQITRANFEASLAILQSQITVDADIDLNGYNLVDNSATNVVEVDFYSTDAFRISSNTTTSFRQVTTATGGSVYHTMWSYDAGATERVLTQWVAEMTDTTAGAWTSKMSLGLVYGGAYDNNRFQWYIDATDTVFAFDDGTYTGSVKLRKADGDLELNGTAIDLGANLDLRGNYIHDSSGSNVLNVFFEGTRDLILDTNSSVNAPLIYFRGNNSLGTNENWGNIWVDITDSDWSLGDSEMIFGVISLGSTAEIMRISGDQRGVIPNNDLTWNLGTSSFAWANVATAGMTISTGGGNADATVNAARVIYVPGSASLHQVIQMTQYSTLHWTTASDVSLASSKHPITIGPYTTGSGQLTFDTNEIMARKIQYYGTISVSFVNGSPSTITRASGSFITDGFTAPGMLSVYGSTSNDTDTGYIITAVAATTLTLKSGVALTNEGPVSCRLVLGTAGNILYYNDYGGPQVFHDFALEAGDIMTFTHYGGTPGASTGNHVLTARSFETAGFGGANDAIEWRAKPNGGSLQHGFGYDFDSERWYIDTGNFAMEGGVLRFEDANTNPKWYGTNSASALVELAQFNVNLWDDTAGSEDIDFALKIISGGTLATRWYQQGRVMIHDHNQGTSADALSYIRFRGRDSGSASKNYASIFGRANVTTAGSEDGSIRFEAWVSGVQTNIAEIGSNSGTTGIFPMATATHDLGGTHTGLNRYWQNLYVGEILLDSTAGVTNEAGIRSNTSGDLIYRSHATGSEHLWEVGNAEFSAMRLSEASGQTTLAIISDDGAADNIILEFNANNAAAAETVFGRFVVNPTDATAASEDGQFEFWLVEAGSMTSQIVMSSTVFRPVTSLSHVLGGTSNLWNGVYSDYFYTDSGASPTEITRKKVTYHTHEMRERWATSGANEFWSFIPYISGAANYSKEFAFDFTKNQPTAGTAGVWIFDEAPVVDYVNLYEIWHEGLTTLPGAHTFSGAIDFDSTVTVTGGGDVTIQHSTSPFLIISNTSTAQFSSGGIEINNSNDQDSANHKFFVDQRSAAAPYDAADFRWRYTDASGYFDFITFDKVNNQWELMASKTGTTFPTIHIRNTTVSVYANLLNRSGSLITWPDDRSSMSMYGDGTNGLFLADTSQAILSLFTNVGTGTTSDDPTINFYSNSSTGTTRQMASIVCDITDVTNGSEDATVAIYTIAQGSLDLRGRFKAGGSNETQFLIQSPNTLSPQLYFQADDSGGSLTNYARFTGMVLTTTAGSEEGRLLLDLADGVDGSLDNFYEFNTDNLLPGSGKTSMDLGSATQEWDNVYVNTDVIINTEKVATEYYTHITAEESGAPDTTVSSGWQFSFGNGSVGSGGGPIVMVPSGYTCHAVAMSLKVGGYGTQVDVDLGVNGTALGVNYRVSLTAATSGTTEFATPYALSDGDRLNFQTTTSTGVPTGPCYASVLLRYTKT